jgi:glutaminyl-tRNA synthetase
MVEIEFLQHFLREELNKTALRMMVVLRPLKVVLTNWPENFVDELQADNNPEDENAGTRTIKMGREIYIDRDDFMEEPIKGFFRLAPNKEVRLKHAYMITCTDIVKDEAGEVIELHCTVDMQSRGGESPDGHKVKGTLHWVWAGDAVPVKVNLYDHLFTLRNMSDMEEGKDYKDYLNPKSLIVLENSLAEPLLAKAKPLDKFQFMRLGYFCADTDMTESNPVFNLTVSLKDSWAKELKKQ